MVGRTATDFIFVAVVFLARLKSPAAQIVHGIRFDGPVVT